MSFRRLRIIAIICGLCGTMLSLIGWVAGLIYSGNGVSAGTWPLLVFVSAIEVVLSVALVYFEEAIESFAARGRVIVRSWTVWVAILVAIIVGVIESVVFSRFSTLPYAAGASLARDGLDLALAVVVLLLAGGAAVASLFGGALLGWRLVRIVIPGPIRSAGLGRLRRWLLSRAGRWGKGRDPSLSVSIGTSEVELGQYIERMLMQQGYVVRRDLKGKDVDIDILAERNGERIVVEVKGGSRVGLGTAQRLLGEVIAARADRGILVTGGEFTAAAQEWASSEPIELWDGASLVGG